MKFLIFFALFFTQVNGAYADFCNYGPEICALRYDSGNAEDPAQEVEDKDLDILECVIHKDRSSLKARGMTINEYLSELSSQQCGRDLELIKKAMKALFTPTSG